LSILVLAILTADFTTSKPELKKKSNSEKIFPYENYHYKLATFLNW